MNSQHVDVTGLTHFLERLGRCYKHPGTLYLVGGSSLILVAAKESTLDIDLQFEIPPNHEAEFIRCLRQVSRDLRMPVERASPDQFIPLPAGYKERRRFIERYGLLDVFHFDFYSIALSKLHRGNEKDFADIVSMVQEDVIDLQILEQFFQEILPQLDLYSLETDAEGFQRRFQLFKERLIE